MREKELVYRMKCVFILDSAGANLDILGTSVQLVSETVGFRVLIPPMTLITEPLQFFL